MTEPRPVTRRISWPALDGDRGAGVLVDADPEQLGRLRHDHQQPAVAVALVEVLVDDRGAEQAEAGRHLGHALLGGRTRAAERDHVGRLDAGARGGAADHGTAGVGPHDRVADGRAADDRGELELVATGHEHAGGSVDLGHQRGVLRVAAALGAAGAHVAGTQLAEQRVVHLDDLVAEAGGGRDHHDPRPGLTAGGHEVAEDGAVAELVLRAADDHQPTAGVRRGRGRVGGFRHDREG